MRMRNALSDGAMSMRSVGMASRISMGNARRMSHGRPVDVYIDSARLQKKRNASSAWRALMN